MNFVDSFIWATIFSYFAAFVWPIQFEKKMSMLDQKFMYLILCAVLYVAIIFFANTILWGLLGVSYSFMAVYCFGGGQDWGSTSHNLFMATWDLALAVCLFSKVIL